MSLDAETIARLVLTPAPPADIQSGIVLAAGRGTRLGPLGLATPKALLDIGGSILLDQALDAFTKTGVSNKIVNASHLADQIIAHVGNRGGEADARISAEDTPLETGGGVLKSSALAGGRTVLCRQCRCLVGGIASIRPKRTCNLLAATSDGRAFAATSNSEDRWL